MHFKRVMISTMAAMKIVDHATRGGKFEICGYLMGFACEGIFYVLDAVELPLIGTDSRVEIAGQMGDKAHIYSMNYLDLMEKVGRGHRYIGWYHSHPGFGCWLSGIDCNTQKLFQRTNKTWFALVVDPYRTKSKKAIDMGCFMMYANEQQHHDLQEFDSVPLSRSNEFGVHQNKYYRLPHSFFHSQYEDSIIKLMYKQYWIDTLCSNACLLNHEYFKETVDDMTAKMKVYNIQKKAKEIDTEVKNELHQKRLNDVAGLNSQVNINIQNELIKGMAFQ
jgi:COP9 signalosome complex subunit 5